LIEFTALEVSGMTYKMDTEGNNSTAHRNSLITRASSIQMISVIPPIGDPNKDPNLNSPKLLGQIQGLRTWMLLSPNKP